MLGFSGLFTVALYLGDRPSVSVAVWVAGASVHLCLGRLRGQARANVGVDEGELREGAQLPMAM
eukprot:1211194-Lingulodinium_polyedra.AAC.1